MKAVDIGFAGLQVPNIISNWAMLMSNSFTIPFRLASSHATKLHVLLTNQMDKSRWAAPSLCLSSRWITAIHFCRQVHSTQHCFRAIIIATPRNLALRPLQWRLLLSKTRRYECLFKCSHTSRLQNLQNPVVRLEHFRGTCIFGKLHRLEVFNQTLQQRILNKEVCCYSSQVFAF